MEHSTEGVTITDAQGTILKVNTAFAAITGYEAEEVIGRNPRVLKSYRHDPGDAGIVSATLSMAKSLGLKVVAEGVETREQYEFLKARNCDFVQGFLFSTPVEPEKAPELLNSRFTL